MLNILLFWGTYFGGLFMAFSRAPIYAFLVYQAVYFFNPPKRWWGSSIPDLSFSYYVVVLMAVLMLFKYKELSKNKLFNVPQTKWVYLFLLTHIIAYGFASLPLKHDIFTIYFLKLVVIVSIAYKLINSEKDLKLVIFGYIFGAWYLSFYTFQIGRNRGDRVEGIGTVDSTDSNGIAAAIAPAVVLGIYYLWSSNKLWQRVVCLISLAFLCNALVLINSRGAVLGLIVGSAYFIYNLYKGKIKAKFQKATVYGLVAIGVIGLSVIMDDGFTDRFLSLKEEAQGVNEQGETGSTRVVYWKAAFDLALDHPLGTGAYGFNYHANKYIPADTFVGRNLRESGGVKSVHSSWFSALAEVGFLGLLFFILMIYSCFKTAKTLKALFFKESKPYEYYFICALEGSLITFMVTMTFLDRHRAEVLYWLILFFMAAHNIYINRAKS
ncbi:O-antigen ligase family protein [Alteromonas sp. 1_MG-2023]|uniref:O-antigen ligase family protein n=1 Tax=Alteromonas sp. 1_MG-2023 TaxID=3062669 RepID=UPI0026E15004|nr:O-antigen ligase family protein [Alteromonas sp. 1_MG-2023]MDO6566323.1 O-antigen ligase family protein [Alteromonas sp. 1_MG-2023]